MNIDFEVPLEESVQVLKQVLPLMSKARVPTIPQNYAVWYDYVTAGNQDLKREIEKQLKTGSDFDPELCRRIYEHYYIDQARAEVDGLRESMRGAVESVLKELGDLGSDMSHYSEVLDDCSETLNSDLTQEDMKKLILTLAGETKVARERSVEVEGSLSTMVGEMADLRAQVSQLSRDSLTDALTGVANRRAFDEAMRKMTTESQESGEAFCMILADIDHFKSFNDTHGHLVGDEVLRFVAREMQQCVKGRDLLARYGGEEFAVLLPSTPLGGAVMLGESLRAIIESESLKDAEADTEYQVKISLGVAEYRAGEDISDFIERADACLYRSKENGRNRVTGEGDLDTVH